MSSFNNYIKFALDIKDQNIVFEDYFFRLANGYKQKVYQAVLLQPSCPFCGSQDADTITAWKPKSAILLPMPVSQSLLDFLSRESGVAPAINAQWLNLTW